MNKIKNIVVLLTMLTTVGVTGQAWGMNSPEVLVIAQDEKNTTYYLGKSSNANTSKPTEEWFQKMLNKKNFSKVNDMWVCKNKINPNIRRGTYKELNAGIGEYDWTPYGELKEEINFKKLFPAEEKKQNNPAPIFVITKINGINGAYRFFGKFIENKNTHATATTAELPGLQEKYGQNLVQYDTNTYVVFNADQTHNINGFDFGRNSCKMMSTVFDKQIIIEKPAWGPYDGLWDKIANLSEEELEKAQIWVEFKEKLDKIIETSDKKRQNNNTKPEYTDLKMSSTNNGIKVELKPANEKQIEEKKFQEEAVTIFGFKKNKIYMLTKVTKETRFFSNIRHQKEAPDGINFSSTFYYQPTIVEYNQLFKQNYLLPVTLEDNLVYYICQTELENTVDSYYITAGNNTFSWVSLGAFEKENFIPIKNLDKLTPLRGDGSTILSRELLEPPIKELQTSTILKKNLPKSVYAEHAQDKQEVKEIDSPIFILVKCNLERRIAYRILAKSGNTDDYPKTLPLKSEINDILKELPTLTKYDEQTYLYTSEKELFGRHNVRVKNYRWLTCKMLSMFFDTNPEIVKPTWGPEKGLYLAAGSASESSTSIFEPFETRLAKLFEKPVPTNKIIETCDKKNQDGNQKTTKPSINNWALPAFFSAILGGLQEYLDAKKYGTKLSYGTTIVPVALLSMHRMAKSEQTGWKKWMPVLTSAAGYGLGKLATHILYSSAQSKKQLNF